MTGIVIERSGVTLLARILGNGGTPITAESMATVSYALTDLGAYRNTPTTVAGPTTLTPISTYVFDSLVINDPRWTQDSVNNPGPDNSYGYNFVTTLPASLFTSANRQHVDVVFTPISGQPFRVPFEWTPVVTFA